MKNKKKLKPRLLKKNKLCRYPQYFCFVDVETQQEKVDNERVIHKFWFGVAVFIRLRKDRKPSTRKDLIFVDRDVFWQELISFVRGKNTIHVIAHNCLFDLTVLQFRTKLTELDFDCQFIFDQQLTFISKWKRKETRLMFLDNTNWFKGKLSKWGEKLGLPKLEFPGYDAPFDEWVEYCKVDVEILVELQKWYIDFLQDNDLGNWKYTLASQSFNAFRHRFMSNKIWIPKPGEETELARNSYRGGRTECFFSGKAPKQTYYKLDVNSMYPFVMAVNEYPTSIAGIVNNPKLETIEKGLVNYAAIADCEINTNHNFIPITRDKKTIYPIGRFQTYLCTSELSFLLRHGQIDKIHKIVYYRKRQIFKEFVEFFYSERLKWKKEEDELRTFMFKTFLNSLYGKFGQRNYEDTIIGQAEPGEFETSYYYNHATGERGVIRQIGRNIIKSVKSGEGYNSFVAIASHVTAYARCLLYGYICQAGKQNVYYSDTDSLIVNQMGMANLRSYIHNYELGMLKIEGISDYLEIIAPKHYYFGEVTVRKGVSAKSPHLGNNVYRQEIWPRLNKLLQENEEHYFNYFINKHLTASVTSGIINNDGFVSPYRIGE